MCMINVAIKAYVSLFFENLQTVINNHCYD